jgi:ribosomal protein L27
MPFTKSSVNARHGDVVEECERFAAGADEVVDAHGDEVDADGVEFLRQRGNLQFRADAVGAGDENGMFIFSAKQPGVRIEIEQRCEAAALAALGDERWSDHARLVPRAGQ